MVTASNEIALIVAKNKKPHSIEEELIIPAEKVLVKHVIGDEAALKLNNVSLSNNTIQRRVTKMSTDINQQVLKEVQSSKYGFAIQLDETTNGLNCAQFLVLVRNATKDSIESELLLSNELRTTTRKERVFDLVNNLKKKFQAREKALYPSFIFVHCFIHRFALAAKLIPPNLKTSLNVVVKMVNCIKTSALNSRLFKVILCGYRIRKDENFTLRLAYLSDIFGVMNHLNGYL